MSPTDRRQPRSLVSRHGSWMAIAGAVLVVTAGAQSRPPTPPQLERLSVVSDGHPMAVWGRVPASPVGAMLLVHGRTWSSRPDFDLQVPGHNRSVMSSLAATGVAAYAVDLRGYGATPRDATGWNTPGRSARDVAHVLDWLAQRHPGLPKPAIVGWSRGAAIGMLAAQRWPDRISSLVMFGFVHDRDMTFVDAGTTARPERLRNTREAAASDFISPQVTSPEIISAFVAQALAADPVLADLKGDPELNVLDPKLVRVPTLVIFGERDPSVSAGDAAKFLRQLSSADKRMVMLPGADHVAHLEATHDRWVAEVNAFAGRAGGWR